MKIGNSKCNIDNRGFTLVELMMSLLLFGLVSAAVFTVYSSQQRSQTAQESVVEMQQNLRSAILLMARDIREAAADPTGNSPARIVTATPGVFRFTRDIGGSPANRYESDGDVNDPNEDVTYGFSAADDADVDGIVDGGGVADLGRDTGTGFQAIAQNMERIEFNYILNDGTITFTPTALERNDIQSVQVSLLARSAAPDPDFVNNQQFVTAGGTPWAFLPDNFRRKMEIVTITVRNRL